MNVNNIMDLGGSQSTSKTRSAKSTTKSQAASSDLFKSIIGQKQAGSQKQSGLDVQSAAAEQPAKPARQTQGTDTAVQDTSSNASAPATGNDSTPADNLDNSAVEDAAVQDAASSEPSGDKPVTEDEATVAEEPAAEEAEEPVAEEAEAPRQIFIIQMPVAAAAAPMAPVIISNETYQASTVETIVNDVVLDQPQPQMLMQMSEAQISVGQNQVEVQSAEFTVLADVQEAAAQGPAPESAAVEIAATLGELQTELVAEQPAARPQAGTPAEAAAAQQPESVEQEVPVRAAETQTAAEAPETQGSAQTQETVPAAHTAQRTDAADEFAAQVVREARDMVQEAGAEAPQEVTAETDKPLQTVSAKADADDTDDAGKGSEQQKSAPTQHTAAPGTAPVAEDGRVNLRANTAQPLEAENYLQPETRQMIMNRVVDQVRSAVTPDRTEFYIQLKPDFLGGLSIGLVAEEKGIVAKIMTTSQQVHSALQADMTALQRVLQERGINVVEMDVIYNQMTDASSKDNSDNRQQQFSEGGSNRSHGRISDQIDDSMTMYDTLSSYDVLTENGGSVEYTA